MEGRERDRERQPTAWLNMRSSGKMKVLATLRIRYAFHITALIEDMYIIYIYI